MKKLFRKATTVLGSAALIGASVGMAAAATYPEPFLGNTAIVVGANAYPSDNAAAADIASYLDANAAGSGTTVNVEGGESFDLYDSDKLHFGDALNAIIDSAIDEGEMDALAEGEYDDGDIDIDYNQEITLGAQTFELIVDSKLNDEEPTLGYHFETGSSDQPILTYTLNLEDGGANLTEMIGTDFPLFGKDYYVLDAESGKLTLLNSAEKVIITEGETVTIDGHDVSIEYIDNGEAKFVVEGESTDKLNDGDSYKLDDDYYIVLVESLYASKDTGISKAEISLGSGKVILEDGMEVEVNEDTVDGLTATVTDSGDLLTLVSLEWKAGEETFLTEGETITMPTFEEYSVILNSVEFGDSESISIDSGETLTLNMGNFDVDLMYNTSSDQWLGNDDGKLKLATPTATSTKQTIALALDEQFLVSELDADLADVNQVYFKVSSLKNDSSGFDLKLEDLTGDNDDMEFIDAEADDTDDKDGIDIKLLKVYEDETLVASGDRSDLAGYMNASNYTTERIALIEVGDGSSTLHYDTVVSESGMVIQLPSTAGEGQDIEFFEADEDGDLVTVVTGTPSFIIETDWDSDDDLYAKVGSGVTMVDETVDDKTVGYDAGKHATKVMEDSDAHTLEIEYYADEVMIDVKLVAGGETSTSTDAGVMTVDDSEVATVAGKNLVVVGGSAINSVAAELLGGQFSEATFTEETGIGAGEFMIETFKRESGETALLVAGYNAADTEKAVTYLLNTEDIDTSVGTKYKGTSETEANIVVSAE